MILKNKNAIIYGAGGSVSGAIAKAFGNAGARLFLTGRHIASVQKLADEIVATGGQAEAAEVDAMNEDAVNNHLATVLQKSGSVDISFNLIDLQVIQNMPLVAMQVADFVRPVTIAMQSHFLTGTAAARQMMKQGSGVVITLTATPGGIGYPGVAGFGPACSAMECFSKNLAGEMGRFGVRAVNIRSGGSPDSFVFKTAAEKHPEEMKVILKMMEADTMLKKLPLMEDIANVAVFLASDLAGKITGVTVDVTSGTTAGLNYRSTDLRIDDIREI
jgi:NAD(P)-dependent dehydrogenase (short-subunit alcohol dehydrogenase family)